MTKFNTAMDNAVNNFNIFLFGAARKSFKKAKEETNLIKQYENSQQHSVMNNTNNDKTREHSDTEKIQQRQQQDRVINSHVNKDTLPDQQLVYLQPIITTKQQQSSLNNHNHQKIEFKSNIQKEVNRSQPKFGQPREVGIRKILTQNEAELNLIPPQQPQKKFIIKQSINTQHLQSNLTNQQFIQRQSTKSYQDSNFHKLAIQSKSLSENQKKILRLEEQIQKHRNDNFQYATSNQVLQDNFFDQQYSFLENNRYNYYPQSALSKENQENRLQYLPNDRYFKEQSFREHCNDTPKYSTALYQPLKNFSYNQQYSYKDNQKSTNTYQKRITCYKYQEVNAYKYKQESISNQDYNNFLSERKLDLDSHYSLDNIYSPKPELCTTYAHNRASKEFLTIFYGKTNESIEMWLFEIERYFKKSNTPSQDKADFAYDYIRGYAREVYLSTDRTLQAPWKSYVNTLMSTFNKKFVDCEHDVRIDNANIITTNHRLYNHAYCKSFENSNQENHTEFDIYPMFHQSTNESLNNSTYCVPEYHEDCSSYEIEKDSNRISIRIDQNKKLHKTLNQVSTKVRSNLNKREILKTSFVVKPIKLKAKTRHLYLPAIKETITNTDCQSSTFPLQPVKTLESIDTMFETTEDPIQEQYNNTTEDLTSNIEANSVSAECVAFKYSNSCDPKQSIPIIISEKNQKDVSSKIRIEDEMNLKKGKVNVKKAFRVSNSSNLNQILSFKIQIFNNKREYIETQQLTKYCDSSGQEGNLEQPNRKFCSNKLITNIPTKSNSLLSTDTLSRPLVVIDNKKENINQTRTITKFKRKVKINSNVCSFEPDRNAPKHFDLKFNCNIKELTKYLVVFKFKNSLIASDEKYTKQKKFQATPMLSYNQIVALGKLV